MHNMFKKVLLMSVAVLLMAMVATNAGAQNVINLNSDYGVTPLTFTAGGGIGQSVMTVGSCTLGLACVTAGASSSGIFGTNVGFYSLSFAAASPITITSTGNGNFSVAQNGNNSIGFQFYSLANMTGTDFLTGNLQLLSMQQTANSQTGSFDEHLAANLTGLGGSLASFFSPAGGIARINVEFTSAVNLAMLSGGTATGYVSASDITPTPEPSSIALLGSGLLAIGGYLRRRLA
jgi:PEP-CTERM motif